jgi:hypothetical protein
VAGTPDLNQEYVAWLAPSSPVNTPASSPTVTQVGIGQVWLWRFEVRIPPGHAGYTGIALVDSGSYLVPYAQPGPAWLVGDDDLLSYPVNKETGANLAVWTYNTSTDYSHGWQVRIVYTPIAALNADLATISTPEPADWLANLGTVSD